MKPVNRVYTEQVGHYLAQHEAFVAAHSDDPSWLVRLRADAMARFAELGFPSTRLEEWRYTNVARIAKLPLHLASRPSTPGIPERLGSVLDTKDRAFALLNTAFVSDARIIRIAANDSQSQPIKLAFESVAGIQHPRVFIEAETGSRATVVVDCGSRPAGRGSVEPGLTNLVIEADVAANAALDLLIVQREHDAHFHVSNAACRIGRDGRFASHTITVGGELVRNDLDVVLADEGAECELRGLFIGHGDAIVDNHTSVDHAMPHGTSRELYKGILGDQSKGIFRGRVIVRPDAQKTDATQSNPNLLLGVGAEIDTKPQLEIYADDVKCSHGATVGQLDPDALFYLQSRGISRNDAKNMLTHAFANEIIEALPGALGASLADFVAEAVQGAAS